MAEQILKGEAYRNFINSLDSEVTKSHYRHVFPYFMNFCNIDNYEEMLKFDQQKLEGIIRDYIIHLRQDKKLAPSSISSYLAAIRHFYEMNDIDLRWNKLKKFKAKLKTVVEDKPYTHDQIKTLLAAASLRDKCIILLMASAGFRRGALPNLRIKDLEKIDNPKYQIYKINVYKKEQEHYITYCTPECRKHIEQYLNWRARLGERLIPTSPVFRASFDQITQINRPKPINIYIIAGTINALLNTTGIRASTEGQQHKRSELMQTHGFRKFFKTTCITAGMNPLYSEYVMGHRSGLTKSYFKPSDTELLEGNDKALGYVSAINELTINEESRLRKKLDELSEKKDEIEIMEIRHNQELKAMRLEMEEKFQCFVAQNHYHIGMSLLTN